VAESALRNTGNLPVASAPWRVLIVDDDPDIHEVTRLCLAGFEFESRVIEWISAYSAAEGRKALETRPDIALVLLDVVMETPRSGLELARAIRNELRNHVVRIVLRTGEPGEAPPLSVIDQYEIDDFRNKTELTFERMTILFKTALRNYRLLRELEGQRRALEESNNELRRFNYVASHDMKTPLRGIVSGAELLERRYASRLEPEGRELLHFVSQGAKDLYELTEGLLEFARIGEIRAQAEPVDLNAPLRKALAHLQAVIDERGAHVEFANLPTVPGIASMLEQLFRNLIENAIKFQPGPRPTVTIAAVAAGPNWEIRVSDRGIGIELQYLAKIFEPFQRLHTSDQYPGSGIGLAICQKVAQKHSGSIRAQSTPGKGTTMVVTLPGLPPA
jgi:signal transduction histidine kinase